MIFLRKRSDYEKVYSKTQAIKELENQPIIDKITKGIKCLTIYTKPIIPNTKPNINVLCLILFFIQVAITGTAKITNDATKIYAPIIKL